MGAATRAHPSSFFWYDNDKDLKVGFLETHLIWLCRLEPDIILVAEEGKSKRNVCVVGCDQTAIIPKNAIF